MKMKKIASLVLALCMVFSINSISFADMFTVRYVGQESESFNVSIPSMIEVNMPAQVSVIGFWPSDKTLTVTIPATVELYNNATGASKVLNIQFSGISLAGNDLGQSETTETISIPNQGIAFGEWEGIVEYTVTLA